MSQPTEAQSHADAGSYLDNHCQPADGWRLSSHSISTNGHPLMSN
jgi:hypothetical protein